MPPNQYTSVKTTSFGSRIVNSVMGIPFGILLFIASFTVLYWNEGRVDLSVIAQKAVSVSYQTLASDQNGNLISITGPITTDSVLGDGIFLKPDNYVGISRLVQEYVWVEQKSSQTSNNTGGSQTTKTTYTYVKKWSPLAPDSSMFQYPQGHENPPETLSSEDMNASSMTMGGVYR